MVRLVICLIPAIVVTVFVGEEGGLFPSLILLVVASACVYGFPYAAEGLAHGLAYGFSLFESDAEGLAWAAELIIKILAMVVCGAAIVVLWFLGFIILMVGTAGTEVTVILAEGVTLLGISPYAASWIGALISPIVLLLSATMRE